MSESTKQLTQEIMKYIQDTDHRYAVAIEGVWGSGKTCYLENYLAPALKEAGKRMIRVSLFGLRNANELYERLIAAILRFDNVDKPSGLGKLVNLKNHVLKQMPKIATSIVSAAGISLDFDLDAKTAANLLIQKTHVLVFDDSERRADNADDASLFGAINDFVEDRNLKVIIVTNDIANSKTSTKTFDKDIREKLVWKVFPFNPTPEELVCDLFSGYSSQDLEIITKAATLAECSNARAMLKTDLFIKEICSISLLQDDNISLSCRENALIDVMRLAFLICKGEDLTNLPEVKEKPAFSAEYMEYVEKCICQLKMGPQNTSKTGHSLLV